MRRAALLVSAAALTVPAAASAQQPVSAPTPPPPAQTGGRLSLEVDRVLGRAPGPIAMAGESFRVTGRVSRYAPGQTVVVRFYRGSRKLHAQRERVLPARAGRAGRFVTAFSAARPGSITVRASHRATAAQRTLLARPVRVAVVVPRAGPGARGPIVRLLQRRLGALHYAVSQSGVYDGGTARAVMAYRKVRGMARGGSASTQVFRGLSRGQGGFRVRFPGHGKHVEADLSRQVLALIVGRRLHRIYHTSSGAPPTPTVRGNFRVYRQSLGTNAKGMVDSSYFIRGYAVHGYASVPAFGASHGCLRVPVPSARAIYSWIDLGDRVDVYG